MNVDLKGPAGLLEAVLDEPRGPDRGAVAVVCHPHPLFGGTLQNKITYRLARGLARAGISVLRFNFRGVGRSGGRHDDGLGEVDDLRSAASWLLDARPGQRLLLAGYSFGAHVASRLLVEDARAEAMVAVGPAVRVSSFEHLVRCQKPKHLVVAENDEFGEISVVRPLFARMAEPKRLHVIRGATHAFGEQMEQIEELARASGEELLAGSSACVHGTAARDPKAEPPSRVQRS